MAIGERIKYFRKKRGLTLLQLGVQIGLSEKSADIRIAQYESESRTPKKEMLEEMAEKLSVSAKSIAVPDIDSADGLIHTLFALEDRFGLKIFENNGEVCLKFNGENAERILEMLCEWNRAASMLKLGEISMEAYEEWKYNYPNKKILYN